MYNCSDILWQKFWFLCFLGGVKTRKFVFYQKRKFPNWAPTRLYNKQIVVKPGRPNKSISCLCRVNSRSARDCISSCSSRWRSINSWRRFSCASTWCRRLWMPFPLGYRHWNSLGVWLNVGFDQANIQPPQSENKFWTISVVKLRVLMIPIATSIKTS